MRSRRCGEGYKAKGTHGRGARPAAPGAPPSASRPAPPHPGTPARAYILHSLRRSHATLGVAEKDFLAREEVFFFQDENLWGFLLDLKTASLGS